MAEIIESGGGGKGGKKHKKNHPGHVDMTPMVDLACLLLTFFMLTTAFSKPKVMEIVLPDKKADKDQKSTKIEDDIVLNLILESDKVYWYNGMAKPDPVTKQYPKLNVADFSKDGIRKILLERNKELFLKLDELNKDVTTGKLKMSKDSVDKRIKQYKKEDKVGPMVLIKAGENVKYGNLVDIIDEMAITSIARYAIIDIIPQELEMLKNAGAAITDTTSTQTVN